MNRLDTLQNIHVDLEDLNADAVQLEKIIKNNFEELGYEEFFGKAPKTR